MLVSGNVLECGVEARMATTNEIKTTMTVTILAAVQVVPTVIATTIISTTTRKMELETFHSTTLNPRS